MFASNSAVNWTLLGRIATCSVTKKTLTTKINNTKKIFSMLEGYENTKLVVKIDASSIYIHKMKFPLDVLFILTRGESWYNSLGFQEEEYTLNFGKANEYIDSIMEPFTKKIENTSCNFKKQNIADPKKTNKECFKSIFTRLKELSNVEALSPEETKELKYYHTIIKKQEKLLTTLFNNTKALNLYYIFE